MDLPNGVYHLTARGNGRAKLVQDDAYLVALTRHIHRPAGLAQRAVGQHYGAITCAAVSTIRRKIREGRYHLGPTIEELAREPQRRAGRKRREVES